MSLLSEAATLACPKRMHYGPCGGVEADGSCEVPGLRCVFVDAPPPEWDGIRGPAGRAPDPAERPPAPAGQEMRQLLAQRPVVVGDLPARPLDVDSIRACAEVVRDHVDAVLLGDSGWARVQLSPAYRAHLVLQEGVPVWSGLNCRDRNRVALEGELAALAEVGVSAVHCVTGDHTATGHRPDAAPVFDLDAPQLAALARAAGHLVSVGESPASPPTRWRADRLAVKAAAGAEVCFVNHAGGAEPVRRFVEDCRSQSVEATFIACVPLVTDRGSAELLRTFTSLVTPPGYLDAILAASDPYTTGIAAAVDLGRQLLDIPGVRGINVSGGPVAGGEVGFAEAMAEVAERLRVTS